jgi:5-methyltetrahydrofolate--homocysteine methyltransferase
LILLNYHMDNIADQKILAEKTRLNEMKRCHEDRLTSLGINVKVHQFVEQVLTHKSDLLGLSALLTTTMPAMSATLKALTEAGVRADTKVIVGGAPVNQEYADEIGADGYAADAGGAGKLVNEIMGID